MGGKEFAVNVYDSPVAPPAPLPVEAVITIGDLEVKFDASSSERQRTLYANGRMQVEVLVLISGLDESANKIALPASALSTVKLIHYNGGQPLSDGWSSTTEENEYAHELSGRFSRPTIKPSEKDETLPQVLSFWVSTEKAVTTQIAAEVTINGQVFRSNKVDHPYIDSSLTLKGIAPVTYSFNSFTVEPHRVEGSSIFVHHLGLFPITDGGRNIPLVGVRWVDNDFEGLLSAYKVGESDDRSRLDVLNLKPIVMGLSGGQLRGFCHDVMNSTRLRDGQVMLLSCIYDLYYLTISKGRKFKLSLVDVYGTIHSVLMSVDVSSLVGEVTGNALNKKELLDDHRLEHHNVNFKFERG